MVVGIKMSGFLAVLSLWGVIFMGLLGLLFWNESVGLFSSLPEIEFEDEEQFKEDITKAYWDNALKCWYVGAFYALTFAVSSIRLFTLL